MGLQDPQYIQQLLKTVQPEVVVEGLSVEVVEKVYTYFSSSDQWEHHQGQSHLRVIQVWG